MPAAQSSCLYSIIILVWRTSWHGDAGTRDRVAAHAREALVQLPMGLCADFEGVLCVANDKVQQVCGQLQLLEHPQNERCVPSTTMRKTCARATRPSISICTRRTQKVPWQQRQHEWSSQISGEALGAQPEYSLEVEKFKVPN